MKLRIRGDSIRLRLTPSEVKQLAEEGRVEQALRFGPDERFTYAIAFGGSTLSATLEDRGIEVTVPGEAVRAWAASTDAVGIEGARDLGGGETLRILVEKDVACLTERPREDDADAFPNPSSSC